MATALCASWIAFTPLSGQSDVQGKVEQGPPLQEEEVAGYSINFNNVGIVELLRFISRITDTNFVFNPADLDFRVTLVSEKPTSIDDIMSILLQVLQVHGLSMSEQGNQILIYPEGREGAGLARLSTVISDSMAEQGPLMVPIVTRVFTLEYGTPTAAQKIVQPLLSTHALVQASDETSHLIVTDISGNIEKVSELLDVLDQPSADIAEREAISPTRSVRPEEEEEAPIPAPEINVAEYKVKYAPIEQLVELAQKILKPLGGEKIELVAQPNNDTIFVIATPFLIRRALRVLERLDLPKGDIRVKPGEPGSADAVVIQKQKEPTVPTVAPPPTKPVPKPDIDATVFDFYKLQYQPGNEIQGALNDIANSLHSSEGEGDSDLIRTISTIQWIQTTNSLVISGKPPAIEKVKKLIQDLDMPLQQVFIEALVIRTTINNSLNIGVEWGGKMTYQDGGTNPDVVQGGIGGTKGIPNNVPSPLNARLTPTQIPAPVPLQEGLSFGAIGRFVFFNETLFTSLGALVNALQTNQDTTIMLTPKVMVLDNHEASIFVGSNIAFVQSTVTQPGSDTVTGQLQYRDIGSTLKVKPTLSNSDMVTIEITQEISRSTQNGTGNNNDDGTTEPILKSTTETKVSVPDGYFLCISGQINDDHEREHRGLPCLGGLPVIGVAFSTKRDLIQKDNLIVFLRPNIVRTRSDGVRLTDAERVRYNEASQQCSYAMNGERIMEILNIKPELDCCPRCSLPCCDDYPGPQCVCPPPPGCDHSLDPYFDDYFTYPCERERFPS